MRFDKIPCHRCPQHSKFVKADGGAHSTAVVHICRENWYAEMESAASLAHEPDDALSQVNSDQLQAFWDKPKHRFFSCPYRREKFVYKAVPLVLSAIALVVSCINSDALKSILGFGGKDSSPTRLEQPVQVTIKAEPLKIEQPVRVIQEASVSSTGQTPADSIDPKSGGGEPQHGNAKNGSKKKSTSR
jgi:hypothetical protein